VVSSRRHVMRYQTSRFAVALALILLMLPVRSVLGG
jgi:hypothetical protein